MIKDNFFFISKFTSRSAFVSFVYIERLEFVLSKETRDEWIKMAFSQSCLASTKATAVTVILTCSPGLTLFSLSATRL